MLFSFVFFCIIFFSFVLFSFVFLCLLRVYIYTFLHINVLTIVVTTGPVLTTSERVGVKEQRRASSAL